ncbi:MAG: acyltransferase [Dongiaceae bacterium]
MGGTPSPSFVGVLNPPSVEAISGRDRIDATHRPSRDFLSYIDQFRAVAIIFIVAGHSFFLMDWDQQALLPRAVTAIVADGTLMFLFIAGFLFKHLMGQYDTRKYYFAKLRNVILPYMLVSIPAIVRLLMSPHEHRFIPSDFFDWSIWWQVPWLYATGAHLGPFWFIPMIAVIYLIAPLLVWLDRDGRIYYALPVLYVASLFIHRPENNLGVLHAFLFNLPIYLLGMWSAGNLDRVLAFVARFRVPMILGWATLVALGAWVLVDPDNTFAPDLFALPDDIISWITIQKTILTFLLLYYLHKHQRLIGSRLRPIAAASFGIFFVHFYIQTAIWILKGKLDFSLSGGVIGYLAVTAFLFVSSFAVVTATKAIFGSRSRILIGS